MMVDLKDVLDEWGLLRWRISKNDIPSPAEFIEAMRKNGVPPDMGEYVANLVSPKRSRGRPLHLGKQKQMALIEAYNLAFHVAVRHLEMNMDGKRTPRIEAVREIAAQHEIQPSTLEEKLRKARSKWNKSRFRGNRWPSMQDFERLFSRSELKGLLASR